MISCTSSLSPERLMVCLSHSAFGITPGIAFQVAAEFNREGEGAAKKMAGQMASDIEDQVLEYRRGKNS